MNHLEISKGAIYGLGLGMFLWSMALIFYEALK